MSIPNFPLNIAQGATFSNTFNWYAGNTFMAPIEEIIVGYPTIIKITEHGLPTTSATPVILSGITGCEILNSDVLGIDEATYVDVDHFNMRISTVKDIWDVGSGEITWINPTDITNFTARMQIREKWHSVGFIHELTTENGGITLTTEDAGIVLTIPPAITETFKFNQAVYDVEMISPSTDITRIFEGTVTIHKEVTK